VGAIAELLVDPETGVPEEVLINVSPKSELVYMTKAMEACRAAGIKKVQVVKSGS
jgi:hypothetical protein